MPRVRRELRNQLRTALRDSGKKVFSEQDVRVKAAECDIPLSKSSDFPRFAALLGLEDTNSAGDRNIRRRFYWPDATGFEMAQGQLPINGYLSHLTALAYHGLYEPQITDFILNEEQSPKPSASKLTQSGIDSAFSRPQRTSNHIGTFKDWTFTKINGKHTQNAGVVEMSNGKGLVRVTTIPRTLIDCIVRPVYGCDPISLIEAFRLAGKVIEPTRLIEEMVVLLPKEGIRESV